MKDKTGKEARGEGDLEQGLAGRREKPEYSEGRDFLMGWVWAMREKEEEWMIPSWVSLVCLFVCFWLRLWAPPNDPLPPAFSLTPGMPVST